MKSILLCLMAFAFSVSTTVSSTVIKGVIKDENNNPVSGASVAIKGTQTSTVTDSSGAFEIEVPNEKAVLVISALGYVTQEISVNENNFLNIQLKASNAVLQDVVVTGYSVNKQINQTASVVLAGRANGIMVRGAASLSKRKAEYKNGYNAHWRYNNNYNREGYDKITDNPFLKVKDNPLSTFSIDVDAASYANVRRFINEGQLPPAGAVRIEEMINYFSYKYPQPSDDRPFSVNTELSVCPWNNKHGLLLIGLQGKIIPAGNLPPSNLVFLVDVSGSMMDEDKLPLVQSSLKLLVDQLRPQDKVAMVVYAGNAGVVLPSTHGDNKTRIKDAINRLEAGGSTAGGEGIQLAYKIARENFLKNGNNRVILCTDGDFNVGISSDDQLETLIENERKCGVFLTVLSYGTGNYQDAKMQKLADRGNGNHAYIDGLSEAKKVLIHEFGGTLFTIAKDVKLQIEFNTAKVQGYRLIGYENRLLAKEDFNNDKKDAGELGSGHSVTALYEIIPSGIKTNELDSVDALRYQKTKREKNTDGFTNEIVNIKLRYKEPDAETSKLIQHPVLDNVVALENTSDNFRFASSVAAFGMLLRDSKYKGTSDFDLVNKLAKKAITDDEEGYKIEFIKLSKAASLLKNNKEK